MTILPYLLFDYPNCVTCKKAKQWLDENNISYISRNIKEDPPSVEELKNIYKQSGLRLKQLFNTFGTVYREMKLKDKIDNMTEEEQINLLSSNGMLIRRPIIIGKYKTLVGFKQKQWEELD